MATYPKHYLADLPHELRMRVLDLCIHRQWHDALDILHQNGFTQYEWYELVWFHDHAPTNLDLRSADPSLSIPESPLGVPPSGGPENSKPRTANPELLALTLKSQPVTVGRDSVEPNLNGMSVKPKRRRPRSKACGLPPVIRDNLNTMLARGRPYNEIIHYLNDQGYPGFNKVNLHNWRISGFQGWLRERSQKGETL
jgi:hypothetical protein